MSGPEPTAPTSTSTPAFTGGLSTSNAPESSGGLRLAISAYLVWGFSPLFWKLLDSVPSDQLTAHRFIQVVILGTAFLWFARRRSPRSLFRDRRVALVHLGAGLLLAVNWLVFVYAINTDRVLETSLGYFINPLMSIVIGLVVLGERLTPARWIAVGAAAIGVTVITVDAGRLPWVSLVLATTFAVYGLVKKLSPRDSIAGLTTEMLWLAPLALGYLISLGWRDELTAGSGAAPVALLGLGVITATPLVLFGAATKRIPLWTIGLLQFIAPTIQFLLGLLVFDEEASPGRLIGFAIIWGGLIVFAFDTYQQSKRPTAGSGSGVVVETSTRLAAE